MGIPNRHSGAPHLGGETLTGPNLEADILNLIDEFGLAGAATGKLDNSNFASDADIEGSKFLDNSIASPRLKPNSVHGDRILDANITTAKILDATIPTGKLKDGEFYQVAAGASAVVPYSTTAAFADIVTASITTGPATSKVLLLAWIEVRQENDDAVRFSARLRRDTDTLRTLDPIAPGIPFADSNRYNMAFVFPWLDTGHTAETAHTYALQVEETGAGSGGFIVDGARLNVIELRR